MRFRLLSSFRIAVTAFSAVLVPLTFSQTDARIQDNSFLVEEAYNQEFGVVQHISNFVYLADSKDWAYTFTQNGPSLASAISSAIPSSPCARGLVVFARCWLRRCLSELSLPGHRKRRDSRRVRA